MGSLCFPVVPFAPKAPLARMHPPEITSRIQKGGALLSDMRQLVCHWKQRPPETPPGRYVREVLPKATQARANDLFIRAFQPRFITGSPENAWKLCTVLEEALPPSDVIQPFYYWITARSEKILYDFVTGEIFERQRAGVFTIDSPELALWLRSTCAREGLLWSDVVTIKVARAMLAALRDFGVLTGTSKKRIAGGTLSLEAFALIAYTLRVEVADSRDLVSHSDWRLFLLSQSAVERLLLEAHQHGWLHYQAAGAVTRLEFPEVNFSGYVRLVLAR